MNSFTCYRKKLQDLCSGCLRFTRLFICCFYRDLLSRINPFFAYVLYFISISFLGFGILKALKPRTEFKPRNLDLFFTSVSATTVSSMSTVEMEVFSNSQLIIMTILMFVGGEVFTSMVGLHLKRSKIIRTWRSQGRVESVESELGSPPNLNLFDQIELNMITVHDSGLTRFESRDNVLPPDNPFLKYDSMKFLGFVVLGYLVLIHILGVTSVLGYFALISSAENVVRKKGLKTSTFAIFLVVSTFASCGFVPTNENMIVFSKNSGLLWILIPQMLLGNTLFPCCLRFVIWVLGKKIKKVEAKHLLENSEGVGYHHLLPGMHSMLLGSTVFGFILIGIILFCSLEWNSDGLRGMSSYEKVVGVIFQCANARHTGETIVDLSTIAPAILVFFVVLMLVSLPCIIFFYWDHHLLQ